jgi:hypothetical protein
LKEPHTQISKKHHKAPKRHPTNNASKKIEKPWSKRPFRG